MVPEGWELLTLGQLYEFKNGLNADKASYGHGVPFVNVMDIFAADQLSASSLRGTVAASEKTMREFSVNSGDVLFNRTSEIAKEIAFSAVYQDTQPAVFGGFVIRGRPKSDSIDIDYSRYLFKSTSFRKEAIKACQGAVRANISQKDLAKIEMRIPPLPEQKKIAQILSTWDQAITATERLLENSQQRKKGLMQQLLTGRKRLPGFEGEWEDGHLKDIAAISKGKALSSKDLEDGVFPVVAGGKTSPYTHKTYTHDHAITVSASGAYAGYVAYHEYKFWASDCSVVEASEESNIEFLYHLMTWNQQRIYALQSGGAQPHVYPKDLHAIRVLIPSKKEQQAIANILTTASKETEQLQNRVNRLKQEKKALMQQLLTGKRRVNVDTEAA